MVNKHHVARQGVQSERATNAPAAKATPHHLLIEIVSLTNLTTRPSTSQLDKMAPSATGGKKQKKKWSKGKGT
jgi:hypothetical protein